MDRRQELSDFLRSRRTRLTPHDVGLPSHGGRRRVAGLRREEVAILASISVDYYVRLEQGRVEHVSQSVLDAVCSALRLNRDEQMHLRNLVGREDDTVRRTAAGVARPGLGRMIRTITSGPAYVLSRHMQILSWNYLAELIFTGLAQLPAQERNMAQYVFLDPSARDTFADWQNAARSTAAYLRVVGGQYPDDPNLATLVGELSLKSEDFRRKWAEHPVATRSFGDKTFVHPLVGEVALSYEALAPSIEFDEMVFIFYPRSGTDAESALQLLASWGRPDAAAEATAEDSSPMKPTGHPAPEETHRHQH
jgi:transcriptional regulator with XRE-family HTH domain